MPRGREPSRDPQTDRYNAESVKAEKERQRKRRIRRKKRTDTYPSVYLNPDVKS